MTRELWLYIDFHGFIRFSKNEASFLGGSQHKGYIGIPIGVLLSMETTIGLCDLVFRAFVSFKLGSGLGA